MKQIIGFALLFIWMSLFILVSGEPMGEYETNTPTWVGWVVIIVLLGLPFIALNLIMSDIDKIDGAKH